MVTSQEQALGTENFRQNQAIFRKYTAVDGVIKTQIVPALEPVFLSALVEQLSRFGQVSALTVIQHILTRYGTIDKIDLENNVVKMMGSYDPTEPLA